MDFTCVQQEEKLCFKLSGVMLVGEIADACNALSQGLQQSKNAGIDMSDVTDCDTAGVQMLVSAVKSAEAASKEISFTSSCQVVTEAADRIGIDLEKLLRS